MTTNNNSRELNGKQLYFSFLAGAQKIFDNQQHLNKINVFPVPDADTGTNLASTMRSIIDTSIPTDNIKITASALADAALIGARGNSGIIFAQFIYGFSNEIKNEQNLSIERFIEIIKEAVNYAYAAIANPVEGTMITVLREWSEALETIHYKIDDFKQLITESYQSAKESLSNTTKKLEVLAKANVVDAGAKGFVVFLEGMTNFFKHEKIKEVLSIRNISKTQETIENENINHEILGFRYCTEGLIEGTNISKEELKSRIQNMGDSMVIAGSKNKLRFHIHTDNPLLLFQRIEDIGDITYQKVDDMKMQQEIAVNRKKPIALMTDSTCDLPQELIEKHQIHVVPLNIKIGNNNYIDRITIDGNRFYKLFDTYKEKPISAQPGIKEYTNKLSFLSTHYDSVIGLSLNSHLSGTYSNALQSAISVGSQMNKRIDIIDSKRLTASLGLLVLRMAETIEEGKYNQDELLKLAHEWIKKSPVFVSVTTLKYMVRSGRVSPLKGFIANMLGMTPIVSLDENGKSTLLDKSFSEKGSMKKIMKRASKIIENNELWGYAITHANNLKTARWYEKELSNLTGMAPKFINSTSPVLGANAGPGVVAVSFLIK